MLLTSIYPFPTIFSILPKAKLTSYTYLSLQELSTLMYLKFCCLVKRLTNQISRQENKEKKQQSVMRKLYDITIDAGNVLQRHHHDKGKHHNVISLQHHVI